MNNASPDRLSPDKTCLQGIRKVSQFSMAVGRKELVLGLRRWITPTGVPLVPFALTSIISPMHSTRNVRLTLYL